MADLPRVVAFFAILVKRLAALALFAGAAGGAWAQSVALQGMGLIGLGKLPDANASDAIRYQLED